MSDNRGLGIKGWISGQKPQARPTEAKLEPVVLDKRRIAVLPLANMSPDPQDEYFSDGMTEELISAISKVPGLRVISRTSVMQYKNQTKPAVSIGRELNVGSLLEGSVRKAGNRVRITVQLIDSSTDDHLWAENYDRNLNDVFAIQSEVATKVAGSLITRVFSGIQWKDTDDVEAYTLYMRATQLYHEGTGSSLREAIELFERAVQRDPRFVRAYTGLAIAWLTMGGRQHEDFAVATSKAEIAARKALETGPDWAEAHAAIAAVHSTMDRYHEAISEAEKAIRINPNLSRAYTVLGIQHAALGDLAQGLEDIRRAYDLDPLFYITGCIFVEVSMVSGRMEEALQIAERMRELTPRNPGVYGLLAEYYALKKDFATAQKMLDIGLQISPREPELRTRQGILYALAGRKKEAEEQLQLYAQSEPGHLFGELYINAALGNLDEAFKALMKMTEDHSWPFLIKTDPFFEELRKDPRFDEFCRKMGFPP